jgi:hypothetical protein
MNAQIRSRTLALAVLAACVAGPAVALPPVESDPQALQALGEPVTRIPTAHRVYEFEPLDAEHVMLSISEEQRYLLTLNRECFGLRFARHVGITASDDTIWAGFDALTADGEACSIREIHLVPHAGSL